MKSLVLAAGLAGAALLPFAAAAAEQHVVVQPDALKWEPAPPAFPKGGQMAVLYGDPSKAVPFALRFKVPAGFKVPPHSHPGDENLTVISGTLGIGMGDKLDESKGVTIKAGGVSFMPKGMHHYAWFPEETVLQLNGIGPVGITYVNPKDDPRKTN